MFNTTEYFAKVVTGMKIRAYSQYANIIYLENMQGGSHLSCGLSVTGINVHKMYSDEVLVPILLYSKPNISNTTCVHLHALDQ